MIDESTRRLAEKLVREATRADVTISCAESCTGGLVSGAITDVPGSSAVFVGSVVSYAIDVKRSLLHVEDGILDTPGVGAVSSECAAQMCKGIALLLGTDVSVSITGIAGPGGEEPGKPVGTVWFGLYSRGTIKTERTCFPGDREQVRMAAVRHALELLYEGIL